MAVVCFLLGLGLLLASAHAFTTYPLSLMLIRRWRHPASRPAVRSSRPLSYAICVCAYNEEQVIESKAENLLALRSVLPGIEILVYVDAASDRTAELLAKYAGTIRIVQAEERHGKTYGMNVLVSMTRADVLIFSDANVTMDIPSVQNLPSYFADPEVGCVSGHLRYRNPGDSATASTGSLYWRLEEWTKRLETDCGGAIGADGSFFAMRRSLHTPPPVHIIDDFFLALQVVIKGARVVQADDVVVFERSASDAAEEYRRKVRIGCQSFNVHRLLRAELRALPAFTRYKYVSHKLLRWICGYLFLASAVFIEAGLVLAGADTFAVVLLLVALTCYGLGALLRVAPFSNLWEVFISVMGTGVGVWKSIRGERFQTWAPPASARSGQA